MYIHRFNIVLLLFFIIQGTNAVQAETPTPPPLPTYGHVTTPDYGQLIDDAFVHGFVHNIVGEYVDNEWLLSLTVGCAWNGKHSDSFWPERAHFSVWTRDLYWGFKGWIPAGDDQVLAMMRDSIWLLKKTKDRNQALGQSELWPLNDERFYIPQAFLPKLEIAVNFFPWNAESQAHFILLVQDYWRLTHDRAFLELIWPDVCYVARTIELLDTTGNNLPDHVYGSYDYQGVGPGTEEPWLCATVYATYRAMDELGQAMNAPELAKRYATLAEAVKAQMNKDVADGGLWTEDGELGGHFVNMHYLKETPARADNTFIPYENLGPIFYGVTSPERSAAIFEILDANYERFYDLKYGPMYVARAVRNEETEVEYSSTPWLGFVDVYCRGELGIETNRDRIWQGLTDHAYDVDHVAFPEGIGIFGYLTGCAGRSWDNGNFFHTLLESIYGVRKKAAGLVLSNPKPVAGFALTTLENLQWQGATYTVRFKGEGKTIASLTLDGTPQTPVNGDYTLSGNAGAHEVVVQLGK